MSIRSIERFGLKNIAATGKYFAQFAQNRFHPPFLCYTIVTV